MRGRLVIDIVPTRGHDESGMHGAIWEHFDAKQFELRADKPLTLVSYSASQIPTAYIEPTSIGAELIPMPMFLDPDWYINVRSQIPIMPPFEVFPTLAERGGGLN